MALIYSLLYSLSKSRFIINSSLIMICLAGYMGCTSSDINSTDYPSSSVNTAVIECGDGICHPSENAQECSTDCAFCGDRSCNQNETAQTCPLDCALDLSSQTDQEINQTIDQDFNVSTDQGLSPIDQAIPQATQDQSTSQCGDLVCDLDENQTECPQDCEDFLLPSGPQPDPNEGVIGHIDGISQQGNRWEVSGWACHIGWAPSIEVAVYTGGNRFDGTFLKRVLAQDQQEDAVGNVCGTLQGDHRFNIPFTQDELEQYAGEPIFMHALSPIGNEHTELTNSGDFSLPRGMNNGQHNGGSNHDSLPVDLNEVIWLHTNVSNWPITTSLTVRFQGGNLCLEYDKKNVWPPVSIPHSSGMGDVDVVANPWVILEYQGQWIAGTWEWLAVGSTCKPLTSVAGDHIKQPNYIPIDWTPSSGQRLYLMVSALARFSHISNVQERSQIIEVIWP